MSFNIINLNAVESAIEADLENPLIQSNNFQIVDLTISDSVEQIYLENLNISSSGFQIFDLEIDDAIQTYYNQPIEEGITEILYTSITNGPFSDSPYIFLKEDNLPYVQPDEILINPKVFRLPENAIIKNLSFINSKGPIPITIDRCNIINFNAAFNIANTIFTDETTLSDFNISKSPSPLPNITDNVYFMFQGVFLNPSQIKMTITYTV
jgi:hypothetical protein